MTDGIIKYTIEHTTFDARIPYDLYGQLEDTRTRLHHLGLIGVDTKGIGYGNISLKEDGNNQIFYVSATQTGYLTKLGTSLYTQVTNYNFSTFTLYSKGKKKPSSEALSHAMVYELDPAIRAVIHIHSKPLWLFLQQQGTLATTAPYGTRAMTEEIAGLYPDSAPLSTPLFVMKGHEDGIIAFGETLQKTEKELLNLLKNYLHVSSVANFV